MIQIGDRLVFVRTLDGQPLIGSIRAAEWQDSPDAGSCVLHWPMVYLEQQTQAKDGQSRIAYVLRPPFMMFPMPSLEVRFSQRAILTDAAVKQMGEVYERAKKGEQQRASGLVLPDLVPSGGNGRSLRAVE